MTWKLHTLFICFEASAKNPDSNKVGSTKYDMLSCCTIIEM